MMYRGLIVPKFVGQAYSALKAKRIVRFLNKFQTGMRCGIGYQEPLIIKDSEFAPSSRSLLSLQNTTSVTEVFSKVTNEFDLMYNKKAFVHWYVSEGMEETNFSEARESI